MIGKLKQMHVLIIGLRGLGVEVAKNLILAGPHSVSVYDEGIVAVEDLGTNFYRSDHTATHEREGCFCEQGRDSCASTNVHGHSLTLPCASVTASAQCSRRTSVSLVLMLPFVSWVS